MLQKLLVHVCVCTSLSTCSRNPSNSLRINKAARLPSKGQETFPRVDPTRLELCVVFRGIFAWLSAARLALNFHYQQVYTPFSVRWCFKVTHSLHSLGVLCQVKRNTSFILKTMPSTWWGSTWKIHPKNRFSNKDSSFPAESIHTPQTWIRFELVLKLHAPLLQ